MGTLRDEMKRWNKLNCVLNDNKKRKKDQQPRRKKKETFSEKELLDLMGTNRSIYRRSRGAIRQK